MIHVSAQISDITHTVVVCAHTVVMSLYVMGGGPLMNVGLESIFPVVLKCQLTHTVVVCAHTVVMSVYAQMSVNPHSGCLCPHSGYVSLCYGGGGPDKRWP